MLLCKAEQLTLNYYCVHEPTGQPLLDTSLKTSLAWGLIFQAKNNAMGTYITLVTTITHMIAYMWFLALKSPRNSQASMTHRQHHD